MRDMIIAIFFLFVVLFISYWFKFKTDPPVPTAKDNWGITIYE